jgi:hypothetical protein
MEENNMSETQKKILEMLAQGKISISEAQQLLAAVGDGEGKGETGKDNYGREPERDKAVGVKTLPKYLRVTVTPGEQSTNDEGDSFHHGKMGRVNVRVPMSLVRAGIKLTALIPPDALDKANSALREKGINFDVRNIKPRDLEELIEALGDMQIDIEGEHGEKVKVFVE